MSPKQQDLEQAEASKLFVTDAELSRRNLKQEKVDIIFRKWGIKVPKTPGKKKSGLKKNDETPATKITIFPIVFKSIVEHSKRRSLKRKMIAPIVIRASVDKNGDVWFEDVPFFCREYLSPTRNDLNLAILENSDKFHTAHADQLSADEDVSHFLDKLCSSIVGQSFSSFTIPKYERMTYGLVAGPRFNGATASILKTYEAFISDPDLEAETLANAISWGQKARSKDEFFSHVDLVKKQFLHQGQMNGEFGLTESQRETLIHVLDEPKEPGDILAVNGPPGTGKTTLIQSIVASRWVAAAVQDAECPPITVAAAATNQAMINVINAFEKSDKDAFPNLAKTWLPIVDSLGLVMPSKVAAGQNNYMSIEDHFAKKMEDPQGLKKATESFISAFQKAFPKSKAQSVSDIKDELHGKLKDLTGQIGKNCDVIADLHSAICEGQGLTEEDGQNVFGHASFKVHQSSLDKQVQAARLNKNEAQKSVQTFEAIELAVVDYHANEPFLLVLLSGLKPLFNKRLAKFKVFLSQNGLDISSVNTRAQLEGYGTKKSQELRGYREHLSDSEASLQQLLQKQEGFRSNLLSFKETFGETASLSAAFERLDKSLRFEAFLLARHFWEAKYLVEVEQDLKEDYIDKKSVVKKTRLFRRLSKLTPCFVSTLYMLPKHFTAWSPDIEISPIIDLLIVDEAGQALPEVSGASLAFTKRALIVGDEEQISPIRSIPDFIDQGNAQKYIISERQTFEGGENVLLHSEGSLMKLAQNASRYVAEPNFGRGLLLREHFRCYDEIIQYCDELVYKNSLKPQRGLRPLENFLPALGYAHINGAVTRNGGSRQNKNEASIIAGWIKRREKQITGLYSKAESHSIGDLIAVVTPYAAQAKLISKELRALKLPVASKEGMAGITVGTLHSLQGAERRIITFSPTVSGEEAEGSTFFGRTTEMLNVAVSRAQDSFLVFGNMDLFSSSSPDRSSRLLGQYLFEEQNEIVDIAPSLPLKKKVKWDGSVSSLENHRKLLKKAFRKAEHNLHIVSPFLTKSALEYDGITSLIRDSTRKNVKVHIYTDAQLNEKKVKEFDACVSELQAAGANVHFAQKGYGIHSKLLWFDDKVFVSGSFNWLSAVRDSKSLYQRHETSLVMTGEQAKTMINSIAKEITQRC